MSRGLALDPYRDPACAERYGKRLRTTRSEVRVLGTLLRDVGGTPRILDIPCGNGRMAPFLRTLGPSGLLGLDASAEMLSPAIPLYDAAAASDASALPLADRSVDLVLCLRLLHHFPRAGDRVAILRELRRVSRGLVVVSYYNSRSLEGLRRRFRPKRASGRVGIPLRRMKRDLVEAGFAPAGQASLLRFVREQTLLIAQPRVS